MQVKKRNRIIGGVIGFVIGTLMLIQSMGNSWIRTIVFGVCILLLPYLIQAVENKIRPGH